jgi:hypothetical protein
MPPPSKLQKEFQIDEENTVVIPKEMLPEVAPKTLAKKAKRPITEAQRANFAKVVEANKIRWAKMREERQKAEEDAKAQQKADQEALIEAGTHVRVKVKEKTVYTKEPTKVEAPLGSDTAKGRLEAPVKVEPKVEVAPVVPLKVEPVAEPVKQRKPQSRASLGRKPRYETETTETDTTETDTDMEEYKQGQRQVRRQVKKNIKAIEKIDSIVQKSSTNPYMALLESRWR